MDICDYIHRVKITVFLKACYLFVFYGFFGSLKLNNVYVQYMYSRIKVTKRDEIKSLYEVYR